MHQLDVLFSDQYAHEWQRNIARSAVFFVLLSPHWLRTPRLWEHLDYARQLGKPIRVAVIDGAAVPAGLFDGVGDLQIQVCQTPQDVADFLSASCTVPLEGSHADL